MFESVLPWVIAGAALSVAATGLLFLRGASRKRISTLQQRLDLAYRQLGVEPEQGPAPAEGGDGRGEAAPEEPDPGRPTADFTDRVNSLVERESQELMEYQVLVKHAIVHLRKHLEAPVSVAELARAVRASARTLQRATREVLDCSPTELILAVKMHEAKQMLKAGVLNVSQTGYEVGFESPDHFSRRFKAHYGVPPSAMLPARKDAD